MLSESDHDLNHRKITLGLPFRYLAVIEFKSGSCLLWQLLTCDCRTLLVQGTGPVETSSTGPYCCAAQGVRGAATVVIDGGQDWCEPIRGE